MNNMKIVTWNCNGALRKKFESVACFDADVYVIQECESPDKANGAYELFSDTYIWHGLDSNKGIGIFARNGVSIKRLDWDDSGLQLFLPVTVNENLTLLGIWTKQANSPTFRYIGQLWKYLQLHKAKLAHGRSIICGDLNSNKIWDVWDRWWNHSDVVRELEEIHIRSIYHTFTGEEQGKESQPTLFLQRNHSKAYHIDYAFASDGLFESRKNEIVVGNKHPWLEISDHVPVSFTIEA
jgi:exonuclease III